VLKPPDDTLLHEYIVACFMDDTSSMRIYTVQSLYCDKGGIPRYDTSNTPAASGPSLGHNELKTGRPPFVIAPAQLDLHEATPPTPVPEID